MEIRGIVVPLYFWGFGLPVVRFLSSGWGVGKQNFMSGNDVEGCEDTLGYGE